MIEQRFGVRLCVIEIIEKIKKKRHFPSSCDMVQIYGLIDILIIVDSVDTEKCTYSSKY